MTGDILKDELLIQVTAWACAGLTVVYDTGHDDID